MDELKRKEFTRIVNDWKARFPMLSKYSSNKLFMRADFLWIGLCFENDRWGEQEYRVFLEIRPLWTDASRINGSYIDDELKDEKGRQLFINYSDHDKKFEYAVRCVEKQFGTVLQDSISASDLFDFVLSNSHFINKIEETRLYELELAITLFCNNLEKFNKIKTEIERSSKFWNKKKFEELLGKTIEEWRIDLFSRFENRSIFMRQIELNTSIPKIARLKNSPIVCGAVNLKCRKHPVVKSWIVRLLSKLNN